MQFATACGGPAAAAQEGSTARVRALEQQLQERRVDSLAHKGHQQTGGPSWAQMPNEVCAPSSKHECLIAPALSTSRLTFSIY